MIAPPVVPCSGSVPPRSRVRIAVAKGFGAISLRRAPTDLAGSASLADSSLRLSDAPSVVPGLLLSTWGRYEQPAAIWRQGAGVALTKRLGKTAACAGVKLPGAVRSVRSVVWREICVAALRTEAETGRLLDAFGHDNVRIERPPGQRSRLRIIDTLPVPTSGFLLPPARAEVVAQARRILVEGARIQGS